ncbi:MAG: hypothetical protein ACO1RX_09625 [Candidatus Sericytochromatia bacterium]
MHSQASRWYLLAALLFGVSSTGPAWAKLGSPYGVFSFQAYLERGYNTRLGWRGQPVTAEDSLLILHEGRSGRVLAEAAFLHHPQGIHTQILKLYQPLQQLSSFSQRELRWFALEASGGQFQAEQLQQMLKRRCRGEWRIKEQLFVSLSSDRQHTWLRFSQRGNSRSPHLATCLK